MTRKAYIAINSIFLVLIAGIFLYSYFLDHTAAHITCVHRQYLGIDCPSCGLSRSFSAIMHLDLTSVMKFNKYGYLVFLFFLLQAILRVLFLTISFQKPEWLKSTYKWDAFSSGLLFFFCFHPFILYTFFQFYELLGG
ncbi:MAG: DUF2752 domain-containing protein [Bacteroidales bacterium]|nr:DUF2752 domain-containing protein [Bacteroidales bacterium]